MTKIKPYTDIEQSKKLAEFLPLESSDLWWNFYSVTTDNTTPQIIHIDTPWVGSFNWNNEPDNIPCWSLAALLDTLDDIVVNDEGNEYSLTISKEEGMYYIYYHDRWEEVDDIETDCYYDLVDACYEMIIRLNELNLL